jgi:hypothetical protein
MQLVSHANYWNSEARFSENEKGSQDMSSLVARDSHLDLPNAGNLWLTGWGLFSKFILANDYN